MEALKRLSLALAVLALAGVGCGDDDGDDGDDGTMKMDAGGDASMDSGTPDTGAKPDTGTPDAGPTYTCKSGTPPTASMCGGLHCQQTPAELKASRISSSVCATDMELSGLCQLTTIGVVQQCTLTAFGSGATDLAAATKSCAKPMLPSYTDGCLDCFVSAGTCAAAKCAGPCAADPSGTACSTCQITSGCIGTFYTCIGVDNPIPGM